MIPRMLVLQARRADDPMREHERLCFVRATGLPDENVSCWDLCGGPPRLSDVRRFDALSVGGSGDFDVTRRNLPEFERLLDLLRDVVEASHPTFASCFGYQLLVEALGGEIVRDAANTEVGSFELFLTEEGRDDPLFRALPDRFWGQLGHKERALRHPEGVPNLVRSERSPNQALRVPGRPVWASQFHPELDRETNLDRFRHYAEGYASVLTPGEREAAMASFRDSPEASALLPRFLELVFGTPGRPGSR